MSTTSPGALLPIDEWREFLPASIPAARPRSSSKQPVAIRYESRDINTRTAHDLHDDPFAVQPTPTWKMIVNGVALFSVAVLTSLAAAAVIPMLWGWQSVVADTTTMTPAVEVSDLVLVSPSDGSGLGPGTIVRYASNDEDVLGRIGVATPDGYLIIQDADIITDRAIPTIDAELVSQDQIHGVGVLVIPWIGLPLFWMRQGAWFELMALACIAIASLTVCRQRWVTPRPERNLP